LKKDQTMRPFIRAHAGMCQKLCILQRDLPQRHKGADIIFFIH